MASITTNIGAGLAQQNLKTTFKDLNDSVTRLTSGNRIVSAADDAAGLAIGTGLKTDVATLQTALTNTGQAISLLNVADGALAQISEILQRQKELAVQANSGTLSSTELGFLDTEFQGLKSQIDDIATQTNFNGINLLNGNASGTSNAQTNTTGTITYTDTGTVGTTALGGSASASFSVNNTNGSDLSLQGSLSGLTTQIAFTSNSNVDFTLLINGVIYTSDAVDVNGSAGTDLTVTLTDAASSAKVEIVLDSVAVDKIDAGNQTVADTIANSIEADLANVNVDQAREFISGTTGSVFNTNNVIGTAIDGLDGSNFTLNSDSYSGTLAPTIEAFSVTAETGSTDGDITVVIGGSSFSTAAGAFNSVSADITTAAVTLTNADDDSETLIIDFTAANSATIALNTTTAATALQDALNSAFGVGSSGALDFQVGLASTDLISLTIDDVQTSALYKNSSGVAQTLDLTSTTNANTASSVLDTAINTILSARAGVGADQSRFGFAAANLGTTITNLDAARGSFLDTDVTKESTAFASAQVLQQAGISVLAQANLLPQNLLKLLG
jgi:flagellin